MTRSRPSSLRSDAALRTEQGLYRIDTLYKLRECRVERTESGHTLLEFAPDNLLGLKGVLYDDGAVVRFEGWLTEPSSIVGCPGCERQPLHAVFRRGGGGWQGLLTFRNYYTPHVPPEPPAPDATIEAAIDRFPVLLQYRGALPAPPAAPARR